MDNQILDRDNFKMKINLKKKNTKKFIRKFSTLQNGVFLLRKYLKLK